MSTAKPPGGVPAGGTAGSRLSRLPGETVLRDGTPARIWPLLPTDAEGLRAGFRRLSADSRWDRFLAGVADLDDRMIQLLVGDVDGVHHIALVLVVFPPGGEEGPVGVARLVQYPEDPSTADIAVTVADEWQGRGGGMALAMELIHRRPPAVRRLSTVVAADNQASLRLLSRLGRLSSRPAQAGIVEVTVQLAEA